MELAGATVAVIGRLCRLPRWRLAGEVARRGGILTYRAANAHGLIVGYGAYARLPALRSALGEAERAGRWSLSERQAMRLLGLAAGPAADSAEAMTAEELMQHSGLDRDALRLLALFDIIDEQAKGFAFRDLVAARQVRRLMAGGAALADIIGAFIAAQRHMPGDDLFSEARLTLLADGELARAIGDYVAEIDGQLRLPIDDGGNPSIDMLFERAGIAEEDQRWLEAEALYRRITAIAPRDAVARFNLANVLSAQGRDAAARESLRCAVALDPGFAEAWYNLAHLEEARRDVAAARSCLERAVAADGRYADAIYNLARLLLMAGEPASAAPLYERYLLLDPSSRWAMRARRSLALCQMLARLPADPA